MKKNTFTKNLDPRTFVPADYMSSPASAEEVGDLAGLQEISSPQPLTEYDFDAENDFGEVILEFKVLLVGLRPSARPHEKVSYWFRGTFGSDGKLNLTPNSTAYLVSDENPEGLPLLTLREVLARHQEISAEDRVQYYEPRMYFKDQSSIGLFAEGAKVCIEEDSPIFPLDKGDTLARRWLMADILHGGNGVIL